jgi:hypothetical protein
MITSASLILHPADPNWTPVDSNIIFSCLRDIELISDKIKDASNKQDQCYLAGDKFLSLITFMGCSPNIIFTAESTSDKFCFIRIKETLNVITAITSKHSHAPRCPTCNKAEKNWRATMTATELICTACEQSFQPWLFNWRKSAGFCRAHIEITEIYPKEAIPQPDLLDQLKDKTGVDWQYFYFCN